MGPPRIREGFCRGSSLAREVDKLYILASPEIK
jgi:hypothetical protein